MRRLSTSLRRIQPSCTRLWWGWILSYRAPAATPTDGSFEPELLSFLRLIRGDGRTFLTEPRKKGYNIKMSRIPLPIDTLPSWCALNDVSCYDVVIARTSDESHGHDAGNGLVAQQSLTTLNDPFDLPVLLTIPHNLVLNREAVELFAKEDKHFRQLVDTAGHQVRGSPTSGPL